MCGAVRVLVFVAAASLAFLLATSPTFADGFKAGGTGSATELLRVMGVLYAERTNNFIEVVPSLGSSGALRAIADGVIDLAVAARPLKSDEEAKGLGVALTVRSPFVMATSHQEPNGLTVPEIVAAFASADARWHDGVPIRIILRPRAESDTLLMNELFPLLAPAMDRARRRAEVPVAATDQDNADMAEQISGSLVASTATQLLLERRKLRAVAIDGVQPTLANFERGAYPFGKTLYLVVRRQPNPPLDGFIAFLRSAEGKAALRAANLL
jgi:phosphate transport system substrate-binding protein